MKKKKQKQKKVSDPIPTDLLIDIFLRVPGKSIARFRCVSKSWESILRRPDFTELFLTKSLARPRLLFFIRVYKELFVLSSPQPQNPLENTTLVATRYKCFPKYFPSDVSPPLNGLLCLHEWARKLRVICNPVTGESINLPPLKAAGAKKSFFGYDPINKEFKVLCTTWSRNGQLNTHRVLTLGTGKRLWRWVECNQRYSIRSGVHFYREIWINGVLYYGADIGRWCMIVCFDFSSEKFRFVKLHEEMSDGTLINYKGKLGALEERMCEVVLWVVEEVAGEHKWCKRISVLLNSHDEMQRRLNVVGMTGGCEIVFSLYSRPKPFCIVYYNIERKTFTRVNIEGFEEFHAHRTNRITTFLDYVENMKLL
ncbi:unnamed protein product [Microthlaspi erraticum]|uniref:F-box domain-containing protein n=1 Tax=Microthlaspi erraticum TaxID=1685480 RepID=A0A6D2HQT2_9BRAS|nr:unnamed protein product [Microthlaspi erraticum]